MFCKYCGAELADTAAFCNKCGRPVARPDSPPPQAPQPPAGGQPPYRQDPPPPEPDYDRPPRRSGNVPLIVLLCVLVAAAIAVLVFILTTMGGPRESVPTASPSPSAAQTAPAQSEPPEEESTPPQSSGQSSYPLQLDMDELLSAQVLGATFREAWADGWLGEWMYLYVNGSSDGPSPYEAYWYDAGLGEWTYYGITYSQAAAAGWGDIWLDLLSDRDDDDPASVADGYLLPTDSRYIDRSELAAFTKDQVVLIRNEIYARHGYQFSSQEIQYYFDNQSWYTPVEGLNASTFDTSVFNAYEQANLETILAYEREMGWRQ